MLLKKIYKKPDVFEFSGHNYLDDSNIFDYFKANEYFCYYKSLKTVDPRRDISEEIISHNIPFLFSLKNEEIGRKIDQVIKDSIVNNEINTNIDITNSAKIINPKGFKLLNVKEKLTYEYLKTCYKVACKKYHPDVGGKNEDMQIVNVAFGQFHNLLKTYQFAENIEEYEENVLDEFDMYGELIIKSLEDFRIVIANQLFSICIDIFCVDKAMEIYDHICESLLINNKFWNYFFDNNLENFENLALRLFKSNRLNRAKTMLKLLKELCERQIKLGLNSDYFNNLYKKCENKLKGKETIRIIINHVVQAKHAFRVGIIDNKKYEKLIEKFHDKNEVENDVQKKLNEYAEKDGFLNDLGIYEIPSGAPSKNLVPEPDYLHDRFIFLTRDQKIEYINAYKLPVKFVLIKKYKEIRKSSYLLSLIQNYDKSSSQKIIKECKLLSEVLNDKSFLLLNKAYYYLHSLDSIERNKKLEFLNELDCEESPSLGLTVEFTVGEEDNTENKFTKRITVSEDYLEFMTATLAQLFAYKKTGKDPFFNIQDWNRDLSAINNLEKSKIGKAYEENWLGLENNPQKMIEVALPYIRANLELGKKLNPRHTGELQLGYKINLLTTNYAKIKDWKNVKEWIELFFSLPENYRKRSSEGEIEKLKKRLIRANKNIKK